MFLFSLVISLPVLGFQIAGNIKINETYPIYLFTVTLLAGWILAKKGGWKWAGYIPAAVSFAFGLYGLFHESALSNTTIFVFSLAVVLSGMLQGKGICFFYSALSIACYTFYIFTRDQTFDKQDVISTITLLVSILTALFLQEWYTKRLGEIFRDLSFADSKAEEELARRLKVEEVTRLQESNIKRLTDHMTDLVAEIDLSGKYLYVSPSYYTILGYGPEQLATLNAFSILHPDDVEMVNEALAQAIQKNAPERISYRIMHADGHYLWVESSGKMMDNGLEKSKTMVLSSHDITLQKQAEEKNLDSEMKFRSLIESAPFGIHMYTLEDDSRLIFNGFNPTANLILNIDHNQFIGKTIEEAFPYLIQTEIPDRYKQVARSGESCTIKHVAYEDEKIQGVYELHAFQISHGKMAVFFVDITERTRSLETLRISEEKFSKVFFTSPDTISISRLSDGKFIDVNPSFTKLLGFEKDEAIGKTSFDLNVWVNPGDRAELIKGLNHENSTSKLEMVLRAKDGHYINVLMSASNLLMNEEQYLLIVLRDITERIQAEQKLIQAHTGLELAYEATLQGWARALDLREHETADHSRRVVEFTSRIATELGFAGQDLIDVQRGALLHDLGKVGVPDNILLKPGPLTSDEWVIMQQHPLNAFNLLKEIDYLVGALDIPYCHHEHWDGGGYPRGLKGCEIPLAARIFTIVDVWDALLSARPYRPAWDKQAVLKYLEEQNGKLFDPDIVKIFIRMAKDEENKPDTTRLIG
jgi:PAS domain S-box-containing protein